MVILEGSCGLNLLQSNPNMIPNIIQNPNWVKALAILKEYPKSIGIEILSGKKIKAKFWCLLNRYNTGYISKMNWTVTKLLFF